MNKTFDRKDVFSWSNAEDAKQYIGKDCYFAHSVGVLSEHIKTGVMGILKDIFNSNYDAVSCAFGDGTSTWGLCLPADKVKEEKKWRPFKSYTEFNSVVGVGIRDVLVYRFDGYGKDVTLMGVIDGLHLSAEGDEIIIAGIRFTLRDLFIHYTWKDSDDNWHRFGVEE